MLNTPGEYLTGSYSGQNRVARCSRPRTMSTHRRVSPYLNLTGRAGIISQRGYNVRRISRASRCIACTVVARRSQRLAITGPTYKRRVSASSCAHPSSSSRSVFLFQLCVSLRCSPRPRSASPPPTHAQLASAARLLLPTSTETPVETEPSLMSASHQKTRLAVPFDWFKSRKTRKTLRF